MNKSLATIGHITQIALFLSLLFAAFGAFVVEIDSTVNYPERYQIAFVGFSVGAMVCFLVTLIFNDLKSLYELHVQDALESAVNKIQTKIKTPTGKKVVVALLVLVYTPFVFAIINNWNIAAPFVIGLAIILLATMIVITLIVTIYLRLWEKYNVVFDETIPDDLREDFSLEARYYSRAIRHSLHKAMLPMKVQIEPEQIEYSYPARADYFGPEPDVEMNLARILQREINIERRGDSDVVIVKRVGVIHAR